PTRQYVDVYCVIPHVDKSIKVDEECQEFDNDEDDRVCYQILVLEANSCCDHLILSEGPMGGAVIEDLTGDAHNGRKFRTTTQNYMRVSWQPRGGVNVKGM
ncbi:hypothetical protein PFISCL1PPCAC_7888, partial [Pristionchus fissidentatus]